MVVVENIESNVLRVTISGKFKTGDFDQIAPRVDSVIQQFGKIKVLLDASNFDGWENTEAFEKHMGFVKDHRQKIERAALIAGHSWQHWVVGAIKLFVHPEVRTFDKGQESEALAWIKG